MRPSPNKPRTANRQFPGYPMTNLPGPQRHAMKEALPLLNQFREQIDGVFCPNESSADGMLEAFAAWA